MNDRDRLEEVCWRLMPPIIIYLAIQLALGFAGR